MDSHRLDSNAGCGCISPGTLSRIVGRRGRRRHLRQRLDATFCRCGSDGRFCARCNDATRVLAPAGDLGTHAAQCLFDTINAGFESVGCLLRKGTTVDATLIAAAPSMKDRARARDPKMHQSKKGQQWYFGMNAQVGVDAVSGQVHAFVATAGNVGDATQTAELLHGKEETAFAESGYTGASRYTTVAGKRSNGRLQPDREVVAG